MKKFHFTILLLISYLASLSQAPVYDWFNIFGSINADVGYDIKADGEGNLYFAGSFSDTAVIGGIEVISNGSTDAFLAKFDSLGNVEWIEPVGGLTTDRGSVINFDSDNNIIFAGVFHSPFAYIGDTVLNSCGCSEFSFISKFDPDGELIWAHGITSEGSIILEDIVVNSTDDIYTVGKFYLQTYVDTETIVSSGMNDMLMIKYGSNGAFQWVKTWGGTHADDMKSAILTTGDDIMVTGFYSKTIDFGGHVLHSAGNTDVFIARLDSDGNGVWASNLGGEGDDQGLSIICDELGNTYVSGSFFDSAAIEETHIIANGFFDMFITKLSSTGSLEWINGYGGNFDDYARKLHIDNNSDIYVTGDFMLDMDLGDTTLSTNTYSDAFVSKLNSDGQHIWAKQISSSRHDQGYGVFALNEAVYITGTFRDSVDIDGELYYGYGGNDVYLAKLVPDGASSEERLASKINVQVYPNPASDKLHIQSGYRLSEISILDVQGRIVYHDMLQTNQLVVDLQNLNKGLYFLQLKSEEGNYSGKVIIQ